MSSSVNPAEAKQVLLGKLSDFSPEIKDRFDAIAFACHMTFIESGFSCAGLEEVNVNSAPLPSGWNDNEDCITFHYTNKQSKTRGTKYILRCIKSAGFVVAAAAELPEGEAIDVSFEMSKFVRPSTESSQEFAMGAKFEFIEGNADQLWRAVQSRLCNTLVKPVGHQTRTTDNVRPGMPTMPMPAPFPNPYGGNPNAGAIPGVGANDLFPSGPGIVPPAGAGSLFGRDNFAPGRGMPPGAIGDPLAIGGPRRGVPPGARYDPLGPVHPGAVGGNGRQWGDEFAPPGETDPLQLFQGQGVRSPNAGLPGMPMPGRMMPRGPGGFGGGNGFI